MNKRELQNFAVWAKENLENQIKVSLNLMGIHSDKNIKRVFVQGDISVIEGETKTFPKNFKASRDNIVRIIKDEGYQNVVEQFAYTWFNRIVALRFMEVHGYLDHGFKIFPDGGTIEPEILTNLHFIKDDLHLESERYTKFKEEGNIEGLYRYVLFKQCNALSKVLPMLFSDEYQYLEYLLPTVLLTGETIITRLVELNKENFLNDVEVIGWLYQFYISSKKDEVFASKEKITKNTLPAVTQLFTPDWIVKYMAENSIGRIWLESYPNSLLKNEIKYYVEEAKQTDEVERKLQEIRYKNIKPEEIKIIEPAAGSGHILVYSFDLLLKMYEESGHSKRDIPILILKNNLVGLDVDKRASQLAQFALMMKARSIDPRFLSETRRITPKVFEIKDSKKLYNLEYKKNLQELMENDWKKSEFNLSENDLRVIDYIVDTFEDAKVIGSLLKIKPSKGYLVVGDKINKLRKTTVGGVFTNEFVLYGLKRISELLRLAHFLSLKYDVMITNPPYVNFNQFNTELKNFANEYYPGEKTDMFSMFIKQSFELLKECGYSAMMTPYVWMFIGSYEELRSYIFDNKSITTLAQLEYSALEEAIVPLCTFVLKNVKLDYTSTYFRLTEFKGGMAVQSQKILEAISETVDYKYSIQHSSFSYVPGKPFSYWADSSILNAFRNSVELSTIADPRQGISTRDVDRFVMLWYEVCFNQTNINKNTNKEKWITYNKGGKFKKWYGNKEYVIYWNTDGSLLNENKAVLRNKDYYFNPFIAWTKLSSSATGFRYFGAYSLFDGAGGSLFLKDDSHLKYILGILNTKFIENILKIISPTLNYNESHIGKIPIIIDTKNYKLIEKIVEDNILISKLNWDMFETSWDFKKHPLVSGTKIKFQYESILTHQSNDYNKLKLNEERLNEVVNEIYKIKKTIEYYIKDSDISFEKVEKSDLTKTLLSYLIGVLMGRYSLIEDGLIYAGGEFENTRYGDYELDDDGIVPIYSKLGMEDGLTAKIISLIKQIYGNNSYKENIDFIAEGLGKKQNETSEETLNRYLNDDFYNDHLKTYQKRPIYWMFTSGKNNGFKVLIYLHRYTEDTLAKINSNYLLPETTRLRNELNDLENSIKSSDAVSQRRLEKDRELVYKQYYEAVEYGLVLDHMANRYVKLDLDEGVKVNYEKFQNVEIVNDRGTKVQKNLLVPIK